VPPGARERDAVLSTMPERVHEILPGVFHWTAVHPAIEFEVSCYWLEHGGVLIDPLVPAEDGFEWFACRATAPAAVLLSNRHHYRHSGLFAERFGCEVHCSRAGLHEFSHGERVLGFEPGDELPGGVVAFEIAGICPDEMALQVPGPRALAFADGLVRHGRDGQLGFVPDSLMDDPPETKRALLEAFARALAELDFEHVLLAHGDPLIGDGRAALEELVAAGGRTAFEF
jgi:Metallo-beta-lactamase superfamily